MLVQVQSKCGLKHSTGPAITLMKATNLPPLTAEAVPQGDGEAHGNWLL